jgi:TatD DNase family protein
MKLFDVHTHTQFAAYADDKDAVIRRALDAGVWMVNVGTQKDTSEAAIAAAHEYPEGVYATVGLHPVHTEKSFHDKEELGLSSEASAKEGGFNSREEVFDYECYKKLAQDRQVVAIGECGLDYYRLGEETKQKQSTVFEQQIALSGDVQKPLMIHCRNAFGDLIDILRAEQKNLSGRRGIVHFFTGSIEDARALLDLGFSFSFGGVVTFVRDYDEVVRYIPLDRIVLETDAPYIAPIPHRGKRNEPVHIIETAKKMAELKQVSYEEAARRAFINACAMFTIKI